MPRKYNKKSPYWGQKKVAQIVSTVENLNSSLAEIEYDNISLAHSEETPYARSAGSNIGGLTTNAHAKYPLLSKGYFPYEMRGDYVTAEDTMRLCQLAYANVSIVRTTIETIVEISNTKIHVKTENKSVKKFFEKWFERIDVYELAEKFYREYYRSGNVFLYKFNGSFDSENLDDLKSIFAIKTNEIPLAYVILNPCEIGVEYSPLGYGDYVKILSMHEVTKVLKDPEKAAEIFPPEVLKEIKNRTSKEITLKINPERLSVVFYKKQDYEPLATPMVFPILDDIEWKLSLKNMDKLLSKCIDNIILLITMGAKKDEGGINYKNITRMQELFQNKSVGRVIVSDYTTKAEFIVPNFEKILGPEKYEIVDRDIKEGLQNILIAEEKFSNLFVKTKVFMERLREGQNAFLGWLNEEILSISKNMNFKNVPEAILEEASLEDKNLVRKLFLRMYELGLLTPEDYIEAFRSGLLPDMKLLLKNQEDYKKWREDMLFLPQLGGATMQSQGRPEGTGTPKDSNKVGIQNLSLSDLQKTYQTFDNLYNKSLSFVQQKFGLMDMSEEQKDLVYSLAETIFTCYKDFENKQEEVLNKILNNEEIPILEEIRIMAKELDLSNFNAAILFFGSKLNKK